MLRDRMLDVFKRKGGEGVYTKSFDNLSTPMQELFRGYMLLEDELPVLVSYFNQDQWLFITTKRVIWKEPDIVREVSLSDIWDVALDSAEIHSRQVLLNEVCNLVITTTNRDEVTLVVEPGQPLYGIWNLLLLFVPTKGRWQGCVR